MGGWTCYDLLQPMVELQDMLVESVLSGGREMLWKYEGCPGVHNSCCNSNNTPLTTLHEKNSYLENIRR